ncbi:MAG: hypothetical protein U5K00_16025 [Melioribacteraceae bacterium]|nr:hypothetical protein [Melioribacteraceae bacterium]
MVTFTSALLSDSERLLQLVRLVKQGLVRYISKTSDNKNIDIVYTGNAHHIPVEDSWDNWIFSVGLNGSLEGEESKKEFMWEADLDADRVKRGSKIKINGTYSNEIKEFENDNEISQTSKKERIFRLLYVNSISQKFSAGIFTEYKSKTYENISDGFNLAPAIEYSVYPYEQSVRKKFTFLYRIGWTYNNYYQRTIFSKEEESLFQHSLKIDYTIYELWGTADIFIEASNYLNDFNKNRIDFKTKLAFRLTGAFFFNVYLQASYVNDQLYIPLEEVSFEDVLLNQIKLSTQYEYRLKLGVSYTFGSIYNTIVNPRFEK